MERKLIYLFVFCQSIFFNIQAQETNQLHKVNNPVTASWLKANLSTSSPKLMLTPEMLKSIKKAVTEDEFVADYLKYLQQQADLIIKRPLLTRKIEGIRLLNTSKKALKRMGVLAMTYRLTDEEKYLKRLEKEIATVCDFVDWNPRHFLDIGEMAMAVSLGLDWAGPKLSPEVRQKAFLALKEKAVIPGLDENRQKHWINSNSNWNPVCHGGLAAAALSIAHEEPELAAQIIKRTIDKLPLALQAYAADGAYPEGPSYWTYGTVYTIQAVSMFQSALGTNFGIAEAPGFRESALYKLMTTGPSEKYFNYSDTPRAFAKNLEGYLTVSWFASGKGRPVYVDKTTIHKALIYDINRHKNPSGILAPALTWLWNYPKQHNAELPGLYLSRGTNPIAILYPSTDEKRQFYLGVKGGSASVHHGHMDAGSFVFELDKVRWSVDLGQQNYYKMEKALGMKIWDKSQQGARWKVLGHNNFGHSTLTINESLHKVKGFAPIQVDQKTGKNPQISVDLGQIFTGQLNKASRTFIKEDASTLIIEDALQLNQNTETITWSMITEAEISRLNGPEITLKQHGRTLNLQILSPEGATFRVKSLHPPQNAYDVDNPKLKRLDIQLKASDFTNPDALIKVKLQGNKI